MFKVRPYDPDRPDTRTDAQKKAAERNFGIFKLRGLQASASMLREPYRAGVRALIDADLQARGAKTSAEHEAEQRAKFMAKQLKAKPHLAQTCPNCGALPGRDCSINCPSSDDIPF